MGFHARLSVPLVVAFLSCACGLAGSFASPAAAASEPQNLGSLLGIELGSTKLNEALLVLGGCSSVSVIGEDEGEASAQREVVLTYERRIKLQTKHSAVIYLLFEPTHFTLTEVNIVFAEGKAASQRNVPLAEILAAFGKPDAQIHRRLAIEDEVVGTLLPCDDPKGDVLEWLYPRLGLAVEFAARSTSAVQAVHFSKGLADGTVSYPPCTSSPTPMPNR